MTQPHKTAPVRAVGSWSLTAISVNTIVGAGIFALPANVAQLLGWGGPIAYLSAGLAVLFIALCFAEASSRLEASGGPYVYASEAFGRFAGFEVAWLFVLARLTAVAAVSNTFSSYLGYFWPSLQAGAGRIGAITAMIGILASIHYFGVRVGVVVNNLLTASKLLPLVLFCLLGLVMLDLKPLSTITMPAAGPLQQASLLLLFALGGFEQASIPSEEVIDPKRNVPRALLRSVVLVIVLFIAIQVVAMAALPELASSATPLASAAQAFLGPAGGLMLTLGALLSTVGSNHVNLFIGPRLLYALGRDAQLPAALARLHPVYGSPTVSIFVYAFVAWIFAVSSAFGQLAAISATARLLMYASTCLAVLRLRRSSSDQAFKLPGGPLIPVISLLLCAWLLAGSSSQQWMITGISTLVGALVFLVMSKKAVHAG